MPELVLRLRTDPVTGKRMVVVDYASDSDALPIEHEEEHRRLASKVVDGGLANQDVTVTREAQAPAGEPDTRDPAVATPVPTKQ